MSRKLFKGGEYLVGETTPADIFVPEDFNVEQKQMAETAEQFILNEVVPRLDEIEQKDYTLTRNLFKQAAELGLFLPDVPEEYGGMELDKATSMLVSEKLGAASGSFGLTCLAHTGIGSLPLIYYGTKEQKEKYLEKLATGELMGAYCLTEPGSGSDALAAKTSAVLSEDGKYYILNGTKQFITNGGIADLYTVFAKVDKEHFTGFLVERTFEGVEPGPEEKKMGLHGSSTTPVVLTNAKVPVENVLGEIGKGHKIAFNVLNIARFKLGVIVAGNAKAAFGEGLKYSNERKQFNQAISNFGAIKEKLANMTAAIFASESVAYRVAGLIDDRLEGIEKGGDDYYVKYQKGIEEYAAECSIAKVYCSDVLAEVVDENLQVFGGYGYIKEYPAERFYRDERVQRIYEGTNEINRILIPGILTRRAVAGELPFQVAVGEAMAAIQNNTPVVAGGEARYTSEQALVTNMKTVALATHGSALKTYQKKLPTEQELLMALADMSIELFALESSVLRAEKCYGTASPTKQQLYDAVVEVCAFDASEKFMTAAHKAMSYINNEESCYSTRKVFREFCSYKAKDLLQAKRTVARAASKDEKYFF